MFNRGIVLQELRFKAVRSSGAGGQHVNKVSSKIELSFNLFQSLAFSNEQKVRLINKLQHRLTKEGTILLQCDESRSQHQNKKLVITRLLELLEKELIIPKKRVPTKTPKAVIQKRLKNKRYQSDKKAGRKKPDID